MISYQYSAANEGSYSSLAAFVSTLNATVTLYPKFRVIVIAEDGTDEANSHIAREGLDFDIAPIDIAAVKWDELIDSEVTDAETLRKIVREQSEEYAKTVKRCDETVKQFAEERDKLKESRDFYLKRFRESVARSGRIEKQIKAISVLLDAILPQNTEE